MTVLQTTLDGHLEYLKDNFSVITLAEIVEHYISRKWPDSDVVAITFDDGYRDNLTLAAPILNKYGLPATVFVTSGWIGSPDMLSNAEILELQSRNVAIGAHTVSHPRLADISRNNIEIELKESKANLQGILNKEVCVMAYPKGKQGDVGTVAVELARAAGYQAAFSTENGLVNEAADIHFLPRLGIREVPLFVFKVRVSGIFESPTIRRSRKTMGLT
jgi:peptidoglycan/xylan/chitin deacetylase (PgdA/CDA1 family)